jgi:molecular chaperone DnaK
MVEEAERYAEADRKRREEAEQLNAADAVCYQAEKTLADFGEQLAADLRQRIESALRDTRDALTHHESAGLSPATRARDQAPSRERPLDPVTARASG